MEEAAYENNFKFGDNEVTKDLLKAKLETLKSVDGAL
jgi:hypothetical protein